MHKLSGESDLVRDPGLNVFCMDGSAKQNIDKHTHTSLHMCWSHTSPLNCTLGSSGHFEQEYFLASRFDTIPDMRERTTNKSTTLRLPSERIMCETFVQVQLSKTIESKAGGRQILHYRGPRRPFKARLTSKVTT